MPATQPAHTYQNAAVYARTFGIPRGENKTLIGAVLAVLGVNVVIASFLVTAFEPVPDAPLKRD